MRAFASVRQTRDARLKPGVRTQVGLGGEGGFRLTPPKPTYTQFRSACASGNPSSFFSVLFSIWRIRSRVTPNA